MDYYKLKRKYDMLRVLYPSYYIIPIQDNMSLEQIRFIYERTLKGIYIWRN